MVGQARAPFSSLLPGFGPQATSGGGLGVTCRFHCASVRPRPRRRSVPLARSMVCALQLALPSA
uniref:hypothetical protein n=1 Tax=Komagataeibacter nataicola TaxID=265960 RepID=UPI0038CF3788